MLVNIFNIGTNSNNSEKLNEKIVLANQIALALCIIPPVFLTLSLLYMPSLSFLPIMSLVILLGSIYLNSIGIYNLSRILVSIMPTLVGGTFYLAASQNNSDIFLGFYVMIYSFLILPFMMFDLSEKSNLYFTVAICAIFNIGFPFWNNVVTFNVNNDILHSQTIDTISMILGVFVICLMMVMMRLLQSKDEKKILAILSESERKNHEIENKNNEFAILLEEMNKARQETELRTWTANSVSQVNQVLREFQASNDLFDRVLSLIIKSVNANQGAFYAYEADRDALVMNACYAYNRKKFLSKEIKPGEGVLGASFLEKERTLLREIPDEYLNIKSGLGDAPPKNLFIVPMINNEVCEGMIEIASFKPFENHELDFIEKSAEIVAAYMYNENINKTTKALLEKSQQQAETLKAREEELRQAMEEMQSTHESSQREKK